MRLLACLILLSITTPFAFGAPVSLKEAADQLRDRGAMHVDAALIMGEPMITASLDNQSIVLRMQQCEVEDYRCRTLIFSTCRVTPSVTSTQAAEIALTYNQDFESRGTAYTETETSLGQKLCVKLRNRIDDGDQFNMSDTFEWQLTMRDFFAHVDEGLSRINIGRLLGVEE